MDTRMREGLRPTPPHQEAGMRIEPPMSEPWAMGTIPAITAAMPPPVEPPADQPCFQGFDGLPNMAHSVVAGMVYPGAGGRPMTLPPAALSRSAKQLPAVTVMPAQRRERNSSLRPFSWPDTPLMRNGT